MSPDSLAHRLTAIIRATPRCVDAFAVARDLHLPDWAIGAGFIRAAVWDYLMGYETPTDVPDIDLLYFDPGNTDPERDYGLEDRLNANNPSCPWNVRNQARMHLRNGDPPYASTADALQFWLETPTCVAISMRDGGFKIMAPFGLGDLFSMTIRPTPRGMQRSTAYRQRIAAKDWRKKWPSVSIVLP